jgi:hypothetical protein
VVLYVDTGVKANEEFTAMKDKFVALNLRLRLPIDLIVLLGSSSLLLDLHPRAKLGEVNRDLPLLVRGSSVGNDSLYRLSQLDHLEI